MKPMTLEERTTDWLMRHPWLAISGALVLLIALLVMLAQVLRPAPPREFTLSTGARGGAYFGHGERYLAAAERYGIRVRLQPSSGSGENLQRLLDPASGVEAAFLQGGIATVRNPESGDAPAAPARAGETPVTTEVPADQLVSLGALYYEPLWVFHRDRQSLTRFDQLMGRRVSVGVQGSGTRVVALDLLAQSGIKADNTELVELSTTEAGQSLIAGRIDALFMIAGEDSPVVRSLLRTEGISLMSLDQALGFTRRRPYLSTITLPQGVIDFNHNIPPHDVSMLATTANLVVRADLHPALMYVLLDAAASIHKTSSAFNEAGAFPSPRRQDFPLAPQAERFYQSGKPFLQRYLPFWLATFIDRIWVLLVPLLAILLPLMSVLPRAIGLPGRLRIQRWYRMLGRIERDARDQPDAETIRRCLAAVDALERRINTTRFPAEQLREVYALRVSVDLVRERLAAPDAKVIEALRRNDAAT